MADKPTDVARWATDPETTVEPDEDKKDIGWENGEEGPPALYFNWLFNLSFQWQAYLRDGVLLGNHSIDGSLTVDGPVELIGSYVIIEGNATLADETNIQGALICDGGVEITGGTVDGISALAVDGAISATGAVTFGGSHEATINHFTTVQEIGIAACMMQGVGGSTLAQYITSSGDDAGGWFIQNGGRLHIPVSIPRGAVLRAVQIHSSVGEPGNRTLRLQRIDLSGDTEMIQTLGNTATGSSVKDYDFANYTVQQGIHQLEYTAPAGASDIVRGAIILWHWPRP